MKETPLPLKYPSREFSSNTIFQFLQTHYSIIPMVSEANEVLFRRDFFIDMIMDIMVLKQSNAADP